MDRLKMKHRRSVWHLGASPFVVCLVSKSKLESMRSSVFLVLVLDTFHLCPAAGY